MLEIRSHFIGNHSECASATAFLQIKDIQLCTEQNPLHISLESPLGLVDLFLDECVDTGEKNLRLFRYRSSFSSHHDLGKWKLESSYFRELLVALTLIYRILNF